MVWLTLEQSLKEPGKFQMKKEEQFILISGHTLNLAAYDIVKRCKIMRASLDTTFEISKPVEFSPKHDSRVEKMKLYLTRWSVRAESLQSVLDKYTILLTLWPDLTWPEMYL